MASTAAIASPRVGPSGGSPSVSTVNDTPTGLPTPPDGFAGISEGVDDGLVRPGLGERRQLEVVVGRRFVGVDPRARSVAVSPRTHHSAHHHVIDPVEIPLPQAVQELDRLEVDRSQPIPGVAELGGPVRVARQVGASRSSPAPAALAMSA